jgi:hypothetical protein
LTQILGTYVTSHRTRLLQERRKGLNSSPFFFQKDLILDKTKSDHIVESWIGKPTIIKCAIHRKVILTTKYKWNVVSEAKDITRGIKRGGNKTSYTFIPLSEKDFGKYKCTVRTAATTVEHEILLRQIRKLLS